MAASRTSSGQKRRRATLVLDELARYEGSVDAAGRRCGRGTLIITDEDDGSLSWIAGEWAEDELHGPASYTAADGSAVHGTYSRGSLEGRVLELGSDGTLRFVGEYAQGARDGYGIELRADGGCLEGTWREGVLHGSSCAYHYPCPRGGALVGEWRYGVMVRARFARLGSESAVAAEPQPMLARCVGVKTLSAPVPFPPHVALNATACARARALACGEHPSALPRPPPREQAYSHGPGTREALPVAAQLADAHETERVRPQPSLIRSAGLGLFATRDLHAGEVAAFFAGRRVGTAEAEALRAAERAHMLVLDEEEAVALPAEALLAVELPKVPLISSGAQRPAPPSRPLARGLAKGAAASRAEPHAQPYLASLGHYANHSFSSNCEYAPFEHPRFGLVGCVRVRAGAGVRAGAELTVDYPLFPEHAGLPGGRGLPRWFADYAVRRNEDGYYFHLRMTPPQELAAFAAGLAAHGGVSATAHGPWRVLYLGRVEQGMTYAPTTAGAGARAAVGGGGSVRRQPPPCDPSVIGFEYVRTAAAVALALGALWRPCAPGERERVLCVGLGAGSLPLWTAHHCAHLRTCAVELHALVAEVAAQHLRNPLSFELELADGAAALARLAAARARAGEPAGAGSARCIFLDAYDAKGRVPEHLRRAGFLADCAAVLRPDGVLVANVWDGPAGSWQRKQMGAFARAAEAAVGPVYGVAVRGQEANLVLVALRRAPTGGPGAGREPLRALAAEALAHARGAHPPFAAEVLTIVERLCLDGVDSWREIVPLEQLLAAP
ncbi:hypothetical protein T492DRAFT_904689 [Pavlovales sp. CCMP2436]|nr:hypothetical protein T492DRAFT_904689 [Pavlovales sp. CCMP2436]